MGYGQDRGIFEQPWLCSTVRELPDQCGTDDGKNVSEPDTANSERVSIEGIDLYGLKMAYYAVHVCTHRDPLFGEDQLENIERAYYAVHVSTERDPLFGEDQLENIERAFWFMGYVTQLPPNVRTYQLQGIWGEDVVQVYVANGAFKYFSTYGGADRNTPEVYDDIMPRIGDIVRIPNNGTFYEIVDVKQYEEAFGLNSRYSTITMRVYKDLKRPVLQTPTIPDDDPIREVAPSIGLDADRPTPDTLRLETSAFPDRDHVDLFDWEYKFRSDEMP